MRWKLMRSLGLLLVLAAAPLSAQWTYAFTGQFEYRVYPGSDFDADPLIFPQTYTFTLSNADPITLAGTYTPTSCSISLGVADAPGTDDDRSLTCTDVTFDLNGFATGYNFIGVNYSDFNLNTSAPTGGGTMYYFFNPNTFTTPGSYTRTTDQLNGFGSAGFATLDVSFDEPTGPGNGDVVPEPATLTLLATGLVGMAGARRRRKQ